MTSKVCIGLPIFNEERYVRYTLEALFAQTYPNFEVVISDNCSSDRSFELVESLTSGDSRFKLLKHPRNMGAAFNFEYTLNASAGDYFMWLGGHDAISDNMVQCLVEILDNNEDVSMAMAQPHSIDASDSDLGINRGAFYSFIGDSISRFKQSVNELYDCTIVHSMFRRVLLNEMRIDPIVSVDHIIISRLLWNGTLFYDERCRYFRRVFDEVGSESTMEKMTGRKSASVDRLPFARLYTKVFRDLCRESGVDPRSHEREILEILVRRFGDTCVDELDTRQTIIIPG